MNKSNNPITLVVFGATGDLYQNKLATALFNLFTQGLLPPDFSVVGFARRPLSDLDFQNFTREAILEKNKNTKKENLDKFLLHIKYVQGDLENLESFKNLSMQLAKDDVQGGKRGVCSNKLFYLAVPPSLYQVIFTNIAGTGLTVPCAPGVEDEELAWTRVLVEKPFGKDLADTERLDKLLGELFDESQIFRIDHYLAYLAKGVVEKILDLRFGPEKNESRWNRENIQSVKIIFHEKDLVGKRGSFYDQLGAFRDVGQNHMLQMLALVAMENPDTIGIHQAREKVLEQLKLSDEYPIVRGQYEGYLAEPGVRDGSETETFFRVTLFVDNPKWQGVPFILEFGKALNESQVLIEVCFKESKTCLEFPVSDEHTLRDAYEKVFYDCILGDQTIFASTGEVMAEWKITTDVMMKWQSVPLRIYQRGSRADDIN